MRAHPLAFVGVLGALALSAAAFPVVNSFDTAVDRSHSHHEIDGRQDASDVTQPTTIGEMHLTQGWFWDLFGGGSSRPRNPPLGRDRPRDGDEWNREPAEQERQGERHWRSDRATAYRTVCVRLCDGFYFPISHGTQRNRFTRDAKRCEESCPGRSRLFVHRQSKEIVADELVDLAGKPYRELENAFRHRTAYVADCSCRGQPWEEQALARHRAYAEKAGKQKTVGEKGDVSRGEPRDRLENRWARSGNREGD
jgi:hypothetical protein